MNGVKIEGHLNNTPEEVAGWLGRALEIVSDLYGETEPPPEVTVKVLELLANKTIVTLQHTPVGIAPSLAASLRGRPDRH